VRQVPAPVTGIPGQTQGLLLRGVIPVTGSGAGTRQFFSHPMQDGLSQVFPVFRQAQVRLWRHHDDAWTRLPVLPDFNTVLLGGFQ
jgi:hypothetical protein